VFQRKQGKTIGVDNLKNILSNLSTKELKYIAAKHGIKLKGRYVEGGILEDDYYQSPSKQRYVKELARVVTENDVKSALHDFLNSRFR
jgi:hypothetical protein